MAYRVVATVRFERSSAKTTKWLKKEWSAKSAEKFKEKLAVAIEKVTKNPTTGKMSRKYKDIRSVLVTKHNRLYYQISDTTITFLELIELKQSPHRNRYE